VASIYLGLGSNLEPRKNLALALLELQDRFGELVVSNTYTNAPVGFVGADFMNLVVQIESEVSAQDICKQIELIHNLSGRQRGSNKWESRPLDIDLLLYNDLILDEKPVRVPRDDILKYSFVLRPMAELAPELRHPVTGKTMRTHWQEFDAASHPLERADVE
jgi:2-amino-4-hydroxy-6-hydroxymethyldihydropteridine diphosphokinase